MKTSLLFAAAMFATSAFAVTINTGSAAWQCVSVNVPGGAPGTTCGGAAAVLGVGPFLLPDAGTNGLPADAGWAAAIGGAQWVGPNATSAPNTPNTALWPQIGTYTYYLDLATLGTGFVNISGLTVGHDDTVLVYACTSLNAGCDLLMSNNGPGFGGSIGGAFSVSNPANITGKNGIKVIVDNSPLVPGNNAQNPTGFFLAGDVNAVPEPSTIGMFGLGAAAMIFARLRRKA